jgi:nitroreductase
MTVNDTDHPVLDVIRNRWSPYRFEPRVVEDEKISQCLEAARWAASSFNEQPWRWIIARRQDEEEFERMIGCLMEPNQAWARNAGVLILTVSCSSFAYNNKPNRVALHDLGQAAAHLALQATQIGLGVHQMGGVNLSLVRQEYRVPEGHEPQTAIAIGYPDTSDPADDQAREFHRRENGSRQRTSLGEQVFGEKWGVQANFLA